MQTVVADTNKIRHSSVVAGYVPAQAEQSSRYTPIRAIGDPIDMFEGWQYRENVGYIAYDVVDGKTGEAFRHLAGTVFFLNYVERDLVFTYAVTCEHVIPDIPWQSTVSVRVNKKAGGCEDIPTTPEDWVYRPTSDIAVARIKLPPHAKVWGYPINQMIDPGRLIATPRVGSDVFMAGMLATSPGDTSVDAVVRSGCIAREEGNVEVELDEEGKKRRKVLAFLIEAMAWGGESGSPVFTYEPQYFLKGTQITNILENPHGDLVQAFMESRITPSFVGMLHAHFRVNDNLTGSSVNSGIGIVIPARVILDLIQNNARLVEDRSRTIEQHRKQNGSAAKPL
jgi:hypothetical protein